MSLTKSIFLTAGVVCAVIVTGHISGRYGLPAWNIALLGWVVGYHGVRWADEIEPPPRWWGE